MLLASDPGGASSTTGSTSGFETARTASTRSRSGFTCFQREQLGCPHWDYCSCSQYFAVLYFLGVWYRVFHTAQTRSISGYRPRILLPVLSSTPWCDDVGTTGILAEEVWANTANIGTLFGWFSSRDIKIGIQVQAKVRSRVWVGTDWEKRPGKTKTWVWKKRNPRDRWDSGLPSSTCATRHWLTWLIHLLGNHLRTSMADVLIPCIVYLPDDA